MQLSLLARPGEEFCPCHFLLEGGGVKTTGYCSQFISHLVLHTSYLSKWLEVINQVLCL